MSRQLPRERVQQNQYLCIFSCAPAFVPFAIRSHSNPVLCLYCPHWHLPHRRHSDPELRDVPQAHVIAACGWCRKFAAWCVYLLCSLFVCLQPTAASTVVLIFLWLLLSRLCDSRTVFIRSRQKAKEHPSTWRGDHGIDCCQPAAGQHQLRFHGGLVLLFLLPHSSFPLYCISTA